MAARTNKVNLRRNERWENGVTLILSLLGVPDHTLGEKQEPGTDLEIDALGSQQIDVETNFVFLEAEADHAALANKIVGFTDSKNGGVVHSLEQSGRALLVLTNDEKEITGPGIVLLENVTDLHGMQGDLFSSHCVFQKAGERVFIGDAKNQRVVRGSRHLRRPINELSKMKNEGGLQLILGGTSASSN